MPKVLGVRVFWVPAFLGVPQVLCARKFVGCPEGCVRLFMPRTCACANAAYVCLYSCCVYVLVFMLFTCVDKLGLGFTSKMSSY